jgi:cell division protein FtsB
LKNGMPRSLLPAKGEMMMTHYETSVVDNRDAAQMYEYLEARIEFMKRRITELEKENQTLRQECRHWDCMAMLESA